MSLNILLVLNTIAIISARLQPISDLDETVRISLSKCVSSATKKYFNTSDILTISLAPNHPNATVSKVTGLESKLLEELSSEEQWSILLKQSANGLPMILTRNALTYRRCNGYLLQLRAWQDILIHMVFLRKQPSWNPHAKFIILSVTRFEHPHEVRQKIIERLWAYNVLNGVILLPDDLDPAVYKVYTWFPFKDGGCGDDFKAIDLVGTCAQGELAEEDGEWFPDKLPPKMNNCSVRVRTLNFPPYIIKPRRTEGNKYFITKGLEIQILNMIAQAMNVFMLYEIMPGDSDGDVKNASGLVGALLSNPPEADMAIGCMSATVERTLQLDSTSAYFQDSLGFCVPHAEEKSQVDRITGIMDLNIWLAVILILPFLVLIVRLSTNCILYESGVYRNSFNTAQKIVAVLVGNSINIQPKSLPIRCIFMVWIVFSLHLDTAYQTYLMSSLTDVDYNAQIKTMDEILDSDLEMLFVPSNAEYFQQSLTASRRAKAMIDRWKNCDVLDACLRRTAFKRDSCVAASRLYSEYARSNYLSKSGRPLLYCLDEQIVSFPVVAYMRRGYPLAKKFDEIINRVNAAGYVQRFAEGLFKTRRFADNSSGGSVLEEEEDDLLDYERTAKLLALEHLIPTFWLLLIGMMFSGFVCVTEVLTHRLTNAK